MGILTYIKIGIIAVLVISCSYLVWNYRHMQTKIAAQQMEIANLKLGQEVLDKKQQKFDAFMAESSKVQRRVKNEQSQIDKEVGIVDDPGLQQLYDRYRRVRPQGEVRHPAAKGKGGAKSHSGGSP